jgi:excisionase family DNA binding protein
MTMIGSSEKIRATHVQRRAVVYVRQSTMEQLRHNHESRRRQYDLAGHARDLGWQDVEVIDEDLGRSGASTAGRTGFQRLVGAVGLREVGAVFSLEASRLARNNRDWHQLVDLCGLTETLIIDFEGIYDPRLLHDRLLLGLKGTMSEFELGLFRQRSQEAIRQKAARGELHSLVPVGYVLSPDGRCEQDPDLRVREAIMQVFDRFAQLGSVRQVLLALRQDEIMLPARRHQGGIWRTLWREPTYSAVGAILENPLYAGAYVYGRRSTVPQAGDGRRRIQRKPVEDWLVLLPNRVQAYITWETYQGNQARIKENAKRMAGRGAPQPGAALLTGLLRCARCGRRLSVRYGGPGRIPRYECVGDRIHHGGPPCIAFGGLRVDQAVEAEVLRVVEPAALEAAMDAWDLLQGQPSARRRALELSIQQARYEAQRAQRQFDQVEPENRLVAAELERRWDAALQEVRRLEAELAQLPPPPPPPSPADRAALMALAHDFPAVWRDRATDMQKKKQLLRLLIEEIVVDRPDDEPVVTLVIHWSGGTHTQLRVRRPRTGQHRYTTDERITDLVGNLAAVGDDHTVASILNRLTVRTAKDNTWTEGRVRSFRRAHHIAPFDPDKPREWLTLEEAAARLHVSRTSVRRLIQRQVLPARRIVAGAPWMIAPADLESDAVRSAIKAARPGRRPCTPHPAQQSLVPQDL